MEEERIVQSYIMDINSTDKKEKSSSMYIYIYIYIHICLKKSGKDKSQVAKHRAL